jgi:hypothetical protein
LSTISPTAEVAFGFKKEFELGELTIQSVFFNVVAGRVDCAPGFRNKKHNGLAT